MTVATSEYGAVTHGNYMTTVDAAKRNSSHNIGCSMHACMAAFRGLLSGKRCIISWQLCSSKSIQVQVAARIKGCA